MNTGFLDVSQGTARRKAFVQRLAQQAAQRVQQQSAFSRLSSLGTNMFGNRFAGVDDRRRQALLSHAPGRAITPGLAGGGIHAGPGGGSGLNFSDAFRRQAAFGHAFQPDQFTADQSPDVGIPTGPAGAGAAGHPSTPPPGWQQFTNPTNPSQSITTDVSGAGAGYTPNGSFFEGTLPAPVNSPNLTANVPNPQNAAQGTVALIPLGNGVFFNPSTGQLHGTAAPSTFFRGNIL